MGRLLATTAIGFISGVLSGLFGIGGGIVTTPAIRLVLGAPALVAVGTPLIAIIPSAVTGAIAYTRGRSADLGAGVMLGLSGATTAVLGAWFTRIVGGTVVLLATAALIFYVAVDMLLQVIRPPRIGLEAAEEADALTSPGSGAETPSDAAAEPDEPPVTVPRPSTLAVVMAGVVTGFYSGFLGLGGGFVLVPILTRWMRYPLKRAIGTSLVAIAILSVPGTVTHALLGNIDWGIGVALIIGVVPGAMLGARIALGARDRSLRIGFAATLAVASVWLAASELIGFIR